MSEIKQQTMKLRKLDNGEIRMTLPSGVVLQWTPEQAAEFGAHLCALAGKEIVFIVPKEATDG